MSRPLVFVGLMMIIIGAWTGGGQEPQESAAPGPEELHATLPNGLQVVVRQLPGAALARVGMFYAAGSALEPDSLAGLAHLSEHLLTESSLNHPDGELIRRQTLYSTYRNAYTSAAYMQFDTECLPVFLPKILALEADRLRGVVTDSVSFAREKEVVLQEIALRQRLTPNWEFVQSVFQACYPGHPFSRNVGGSQATVSSIEKKDFLHFQDIFITPRRAALVVQGPEDAAVVLAEIENIFRFGHESEPVSAITPDYPPAVASQHISDSDDHTGVLVCLTFRISLQDEEDAAWTAVLPGLMAYSGLNTIIQMVPGEAVITLLVTASYSKPPEGPGGRRDYPFDPEQQSQYHMGNIWDNLSDFRQETLELTDFSKRLNRVITALGAESGNPDRSGALGASLVNGNAFMASDMVEGILENRRTLDFLDYLDRWLNTDRVMVGVSHGRDSERQARIEMTAKKEAPAGLEATSALAGLTRDDIQPVLEEYAKADLIRLEQFTLYNRIPVTSLVVPDSNSWAMAGIRTFPGIKDMRVGKKPGITQIYNLVVNYDDRQRRNPSGSTILKPLAFNLGFHLDWCSNQFFAQGRPEKIPDIAAEFNRRVQSREFNSMRWHSVIRWGGNYLRRGRNDKINMARAWRWGQILGAEHPAVGQWAPDPEAFKKVKYKDLANLHKDFTQKTGNLQIMVAGNIPTDQLKTLLNPSLGTIDRWKPFEPENIPEPWEKGVHGKIIPDLTRGDISLEITFPLIQVVPSPAAAIRSITLDRTLEESLTDLLREKEGLTYSVSVYTIPCPSGCFREISITCQPGHAPIVLDKVVEELRRIVEAGLSPDQIARARLQLTGEVISSLTEEYSGLDYLMQLAKQGGIPSHPLKAVSAVTEDEVIALARQVLDPDNFVFTATGPLFEEDLEQFNLDNVAHDQVDEIPE